MRITKKTADKVLTVSQKKDLLETFDESGLLSAGILSTWTTSDRSNLTLNQLIQIGHNPDVKGLPDILVFTKARIELLGKFVKGEL